MPAGIGRMAGGAWRGQGCARRGRGNEPDTDGAVRDLRSSNVAPFQKRAANESGLQARCGWCSNVASALRRLGYPDASHYLHVHLAQVETSRAAHMPPAEAADALFGRL